MFMVSIAGCASTPLYRTHTELSQRKSIIKRVGLLPPVINMYECQAAWLGYKLVWKDEWSPAAAAEVTKAFINELAAAPSPLVIIGGKEEQDIDEMEELFGPVDFSIRQHAYESKSGKSPPEEPFPEKLRFLDYSLGPAKEAMVRKGVDAVWIVSGFNAVPTVGTKVKEGVEVVMAILSAAGRGPGVTSTVIKIVLSVALVDKDGTILFYNTINSSVIGPVSQEYPKFADTKGVLGPESPMERMYNEQDLRNPRVAHHYVKTLLSDFRTESPP